MRRTIAAILLGGGLTALTVSAQESFAVVVHESNPTTALSRAELSRLFLKRKTRWQGSLKVQPVDLEASSPLRHDFSESIHGKDVNWVEGYWRKMIFSGRSAPPPQLDSEDRALDFVRGNPGAIAYVSSSTPLGDGVRALRIED